MVPPPILAPLEIVPAAQAVDIARERVLIPGLVIAKQDIFVYLGLERKHPQMESQGTFALKVGIPLVLIPRLKEFTENLLHV